MSERAGQAFSSGVFDGPFDRLLRGLRRNAGLTQEELAERAGVSTRTISDIERGLRTSVYQDTAERLAAALGLRAEQSRAFEAAARKGARRGPAEAAATRIPTPATKLVGREREIELIDRALSNEQIRLLTLTGPGGIGKTRLAIEAARRALEQGQRVAFVPLSSVLDPGLVASTMAVFIGVTSPEGALVRSIAQALGPRSLLVLDTFEHVIVAAPLVSELLSHNSGLKILVTSREALRLLGEHEVIVPALELPGRDEGTSGDDLLSHSAIQMFVERARAVRGDLRFDNESATLVREICTRLGGLPLAIELAAARVKHLSLEDLKDQLDRALNVLTGGPRDLPRRQQTMRDAIAWSYDLLIPQERSLLRNLGVFTGGWTLESAGAIRESGDASLVASLSALVDKNLVYLSEPIKGAQRYSMLDVIREFAAEQLSQSGELDAAKESHAEYFLELAESAESEISGPDAKQWFRRLEGDHDNLRAALGWFIEGQDFERAVRLSGSIWQFWRRQGYFSEGRRWLRAGLSLDDSGSHPLRAKALWGAGWLAFVQGDFDEGLRLSDELALLALNTRRPIDERNALTVRGMIQMSEGYFDKALESFGGALELCRDLPMSWVVATSHMNLGQAKMHAGDREGAQDLIQRAQAIYQDIGDRNFVARCDGYLGLVALIAGDLDLAETRLTQNFEVSWEVEDLQGVAESLEGLASTSAARRVRESCIRSARLAGAAAALRERLAVKQYPFDRAAMEPFVDIAKDMLGAKPWTDAFDVGKAATMEETIEWLTLP